MVLDASALLALINAEPGAEMVATALADAVISTVNLSEVAAKLGDFGYAEHEAWMAAADLVPTIVPFDAQLARRSARLRRQTRTLGLSFGDRACLALAEHLGLPALTADQTWRELSLGIEVRLVR